MNPNSLYLVELLANKVHFYVTRLKQKDWPIILHLHYYVGQHKILLPIVSGQYWFDAAEIW